MNVLYLILLGAAFALVECLIGGTRLLFALPPYLILATAAVLSALSAWRTRGRPSSICLASTALFLGYVLGRGLTSPVPYIAWADEFMVLAALVVYLLTTCLLTDARERLWILGVLVLLGTVNVLVAARQFAVGDNFMPFGFLRSDRYAGRGSGFYVCPDHLAFFLEVVGCLALAWALWGRGRLWLKFAFGYGAFALFAGELLTGSRGGFLSAAVGLTVMSLLGLVRLRQTAPHLLGRALAIIVIAALAAVLGLRGVVSHSALLRGRARGLITLQDIRPRLWKAGLQQFQLSPLIGTGASTYLYYGRRLRDPQVQDDPIRTHNDYLELLGEYGIFGVAGLLVFLGAHVLTGLGAYRHFSRRAAAAQNLIGEAPGSNSVAWNIGALSAVGAMAAHSVVDFSLHIPANAMLGAFVFGVLANTGRTAPDTGSPRVAMQWTSRVARIALVVIGITLVATGLPRLPGEYYAEKARVALRDRHWLATIQFAQKGISYESRNPQLFYYLGDARLSLAGDGPDTPMAHSFREGADEAYVRGLAAAPCDTALLLRHAQVLTIFGQFPAAHEVLARALLWDPNSALVQTYLGFYLQRVGRLEDAKKAYARALQLSPNAAAAGGFEQLTKLAAGSN